MNSSAVNSPAAEPNASLAEQQRAAALEGLHRASSDGGTGQLGRAAAAHHPGIGRAAAAGAHTPTGIGAAAAHHPGIGRAAAAGAHAPTGIGAATAHHPGIGRAAAAGAHTPTGIGAAATAHFGCAAADASADAWPGSRPAAATSYPSGIGFVGAVSSSCDGVAGLFGSRALAEQARAAAVARALAGAQWAGQDAEAEYRRGGAHGADAGGYRRGGQAAYAGEYRRGGQDSNSGGYWRGGCFLETEALPLQPARATARRLREAVGGSDRVGRWV